MPSTTYTGNRVIDALVRAIPFQPATKIFVSLHTADAGLTGANEITSIAWPAYKRLDTALGNNTTEGFAKPTDKTTKNLKQLLWPAHDGPKELTITHFAIWDAETAGNCLWTGALIAPKLLGPTDECVIHAEQLELTVE